MQCCRPDLTNVNFLRSIFSAANKTKFLQSSLHLYHTCGVVALIVLLFACGGKSSSVRNEERVALEKQVEALSSIDSIETLQHRFAESGNKIGYIIALRIKGKRLRNESRFEEAVRAHSEALKEAEALNDTLEWVRSLNNIGTDYRRMSILDVAQEYHYRALKLSEEFSDTSKLALKNHVKSLNGLGNIYMSLGNHERADSVLRLALKGEKKLNSAVGQAIDNANIGSIFEESGKLDSARVYYLRSMEFNKAANEVIGISLCHTYLDSLHEKTGEYEQAARDYETAYSLLQPCKDEWHALSPLLALTGIYFKLGKTSEALEQLGRAKEMATRIKSPEHLVQVYDQYYKYYKQSGCYADALSCHEQAQFWQDSVLNIGRVNRIQNISLNIERNHRKRMLNEADLKLQSERTMRYVSYVVFIFVLLSLFAIVILMSYVQRIRKRNHVALKQMSQMRENFFTNITHEFRTPLTVILGLSGDLKHDEDLPAETKAKICTIERQGESLLDLINQLLDISKIKSSVGNLDWRSGNIAAYITMIVESYRDYARCCNVDLHFVTSVDLETDFVPDYLNKIMNNLLSNAFKYTPEYGHITIKLERDNENLLISVADTGKGIAPAALAHIFQPFYQAEQDTGQVGTGVGLALVHRIVEVIGGKIHVESVLGKGTTFHLSLPIRHESKQAVDSHPIIGAPKMPDTMASLIDKVESNNNDCRILIIEDNKDVAAYIGSQLASRYSVYYAENGKIGLQKAEELVPDLIITDLMMPEIGGLDVCRAIRKNEIVNHIPIIVITAKNTEEDRIKGLEAGADAYLVKPFNSEELRTRVEKLLEQRSLLRNKYASAIKSNEVVMPTLSTADEFFLGKTIDVIYALLDTQQLEVSVLADRLCMSKRQFHRKLMALTGMSPVSYIKEVKMKRAKMLLDTRPDISLDEVAELSGFEHYSGFYHAFKKTYGFTPTKYKRKVNDSSAEACEPDFDEDEDDLQDNVDTPDERTRSVT